MTSARQKPVALLVGGMIALVLAACGAGPSSPGRFYVLSSPSDLATAAAVPASTRNLFVGVGPVTLPPHLDRTQIVTQTTPHRLDLKDLDQWAEPLKDGFTRVLARNLAALLGTDSVYQFPWRRPVTVQYQITVEVRRFDTDASGESVLTARWDVIQGDGRELFYSRTSSFRSKADAKVVESIVAAMSANLTEFSREIAAGVAALSK